MKAGGADAGIDDFRRSTSHRDVVNILGSSKVTRARRRGAPARVVTARFRPGGQGRSRMRPAPNRQTARQRYLITT